jgi:hypothetical protein
MADPDTEQTLAFLRDARELAEAEQVDAEYAAVFGDDGDDGGGDEPFSAQYQADGYEPRRDAPVTLSAASSERQVEHESPRLRRLPGLGVRV